MGGYDIQWDLVFWFVVFMTLLLVFDGRRRSRGKTSRKSSRRRTKHGGFRRMQSPAERALARARSRQQTEN
jgi:hypothetical protein